MYCIRWCYYSLSTIRQSLDVRRAIPFHSVRVWCLSSCDIYDACYQLEVFEFTQVIICCVIMLISFVGIKTVCSLFIFDFLWPLEMHLWPRRYARNNWKTQTKTRENMNLKKKVMFFLVIFFCLLVPIVIVSSSSCNVFFCLRQTRNIRCGCAHIVDQIDCRRCQNPFF